MAEASNRAFRSALLVAAKEADTSGVIHALHNDGIAVLQRLPGQDSFNLARTRDFDVVLWQATAVEGAEVFGQLHRARIAAVALVADGDPRLLSACLEAGADACLQLTADPLVVVAQVHAVLRRWTVGDESGSPVDGVLQVGDIRVDTDRCEVDRAGTFIPLTATEFRIVEYMARCAGRTLRPHEVLNAVSEDYQYQPREAQDVFKVYARRIRRKLEPNEDEPRYLVNVRGFGYRLEGGRARPATAAQAGLG